MAHIHYDFREHSRCDWSKRDKIAWKLTCRFRYVVAECVTLHADCNHMRTIHIILRTSSHSLHFTISAIGDFDWCDWWRFAIRRSIQLIDSVVFYLLFFFSQFRLCSNLPCFLDIILVILPRQRLVNFAALNEFIAANRPQPVNPQNAHIK